MNRFEKKMCYNHVSLNGIPFGTTCQNSDRLVVKKSAK